MTREALISRETDESFVLTAPLAWEFSEINSKFIRLEYRKANLRVLYQKEQHANHQKRKAQEADTDFAY